MVLLSWQQGGSILSWNSSMEQGGSILQQLLLPCNHLKTPQTYFAVRAKPLEQIGKAAGGDSLKIVSFLVLLMEASPSA